MNLEISQRDLKRAVARQITQLMAVALGNCSCVALLTCIHAGISKLFNNANVRLRPRPQGPLSFSLLFVMPPQLNPLGFRRHASIRKKLRGLRYLEVNQRFLKSKLCLIAILLIISGCASVKLPPPQKPPIQKGQYEYLKSQLSWLANKQLREQDIQGLSIAVVAEGKVIWTQGFGNVNTNEAVTPSTMFRAGSITKTLNALAVMQLVEQGKLNLDEDLRSIIPDLDLHIRTDNKPKIAVKVTLRSLLSHQSGVASDWIYGLWKRNPLSFDASLDYLNHTSLTHLPDTQFVYSNLAHNIVAFAIERASGEQYEDYMRSLLNQLGLHDAAISADPNSPPTAQGYVKNKKHNELGLRDTPAAGLSINAQDFGRLVQELVTMGSYRAPDEKKLLSSQTYLSMLSDVSSHRPLNLDKRIALGLFYYDGILGKRVPILGHNGAAVNHRSVMKLAPFHGFGIAVMSNTRNASNSLHTIANQALPLLYEAQYGTLAPVKYAYWPHPNRREKVEDRIDHVEAQDLIGDYATIAGLAKIYEKNGTLKVDIAGKSLTLFQRKKRGYFYPSYKLFGIFDINLGSMGNTGIAVRYIDNKKYLISINTRGQRQMLGHAISPSPIAEAWQKRTGRYKVATPLDVIALPSGGLKIKDDYLIAYAKTDRGENMQVVLKTIDDTHAIVLGHGRGLGEMVVVETIDGEEQLRYSGIRFKKAPRKHRFKR